MRSGKTMMEYNGKDERGKQGKNAAKELGGQISFEDFFCNFEALFREIGTMYFIQSIVYR